MGAIQKMSVLAVTPVVEGACHAVGFKMAEGSLNPVLAFLNDRFSDHAQRLPMALRRATVRAWHALEIALAGESLWQRLDRAEDRAFRAQIRAFLDSAIPADTFEAYFARAEALRELRSARRIGLLDGGAIDLRALADQAAPFARHADPADQLAAHAKAVDGLAGDLDGAGYQHLARVVALRPAGGPPVIVTAVRYFFRREVEGEPELARGLAFARMERLAADAEAGFAALHDALGEQADRLESLLGDVQTTVNATHAGVLDIRAEMARQGRQLQELSTNVVQTLEAYRLHQREVRPGDSLSIRNEDERQLVRQLVARYRALPAGEREQAPALLNALGKLELVAGELEDAQHDFARVAELVGESGAKAEARHNAYRSALDRGRAEEALNELLRAVALDPRRFEPFPVAKYRPLRILGAGGFGVAFLCEHQNSGSKVVVKALQTDRLDRPLVEVFREAHALEALEHPAIVRLRDCDYADPIRTRPYLVMDYFDGPTLAARVASKGPFAPDKFAPLARQIAEGLAAAHSRKILHRDVKPANVLVRHDRDEWRVKLIDFGLALRPHGSGETAGSLRAKTLSGPGIAGTLDYAAPEQLGKLPSVLVGPAADVYGFGRTCCFALFGTPQPLPKHWRTLPGPLSELLEQCLEESPSDRPRDFRTILERLDGDRAGTRPPDVRPAEPLGERLNDLRAAIGRLAPRGIAKRLRKPRPDKPADGRKHTAAVVVLIAAGLVVLTFSAWRTGSGVWTSPIASQSSSLDMPERVVVLSADGRPSAMAVSADGRFALTAGPNGLGSWNLDSGKELSARTGAKLWRGPTALARGGQFAAAVDEQGRAYLYDLARTGEAPRILSEIGKKVATLAFTADGSRIVSADSTGRVRFVNANDLTDIGHFETSSACPVALSANGLWALSLTEERLTLWDVNARTWVSRTEPGVARWDRAAVSDDGRACVTVHNREGSIEVWRTEVGTQWTGSLRPDSEVKAVAVSADGSLVLAGDARGIIHVLDGNGRETRQIQAHARSVVGVGFLPYGQCVVSCGAEGEIKVWNLGR
jgi:serine/threonine protein kinase